MNKYLIVIVLIAIAAIIVVNPLKKEQSDETRVPASGTDTERASENEKPEEESQASANMPNPASKYCEENGGNLEIVTDKNGSQFGMCNFEDYSCEEWVYFRGECDVEGDAEAIKEALIAKGLNLTDTKVVVHKHLGKYISGGVVPVSGLAGGGYVFAVKEGGEIRIIADGNGAIMCTMLEDYPDYPNYLIPECVDGGGNPITR